MHWVPFINIHRPIKGGFTFLPLGSGRIFFPYSDLIQNSFGDERVASCPSEVAAGASPQSSFYPLSLLPHHFLLHPHFQEVSIFSRGKMLQVGQQGLWLTLQVLSTCILHHNEPFLKRHSHHMIVCLSFQVRSWECLLLQPKAQWLQHHWYSGSWRLWKSWAGTSWSLHVFLVNASDSQELRGVYGLNQMCWEVNIHPLIHWLYLIVLVHCASWTDRQFEGQCSNRIMNQKLLYLFHTSFWTVMNKFQTCFRITNQF